MKNLIHILIGVSLAGCSWFSGPPTDTSETIAADLFSGKTDLVMSRAAAAVEVARMANKDGKPQVVENELSVASAYLPRPNVEDVEFARKRIDSKDSATYSKALNVADAHSRKMNELKAAMEAEKQKAKDALDALDKKHQAERRMFITYVITAIGGLGIISGMAMMWLGFNKLNAATSIAIGVAVIAAATVFDAPWFAWLAGFSIVAFVIEAIRRLRASA